MKPLAERLGSRWSDVFDAAVEEAVLRAPDGDRLLADAFGSASSRYQRVGIAAALGETSGPAGLEVLREALTARGTGSVDLRCAALIALARRIGEAASEDFATCATDKNSTVRHYAVFCLAACGDDRAWDLVLGLLRKRLPFGFSEAVTYLCRHAGTAGDARMVELVSAVRAACPGLNEGDLEWVEARWPDCAPDGPPPNEVESGDLEAMAADLRATSLLAPLYPSPRSAVDL